MLPEKRWRQAGNVRLSKCVMSGGYPAEGRQEREANIIAEEDDIIINLPSIEAFRDEKYEVKITRRLTEIFVIIIKSVNIILVTYSLNDNV